MTSSPAAGFQLDPQILKDTHLVASLPLSELVLMNDSRYTWLILVPRVENAAELLDLTSEQRVALWHEIDAVSAFVKTAFPCDKLNIATLGNIVRQLHIHVVARRVDDAAWPAPVWGNGNPIPYQPSDAEQLRHDMRQKIEAYL